MRHCRLGSRLVVDFNAGKTKFVLVDRFNNTSVIDVKIDGSVLEKKSSFKMLPLLHYLYY